MAEEIRQGSSARDEAAGLSSKQAASGETDTRSAIGDRKNAREGTKMPAEILNRQDKVDVTDELEAEVKGGSCNSATDGYGTHNYEWTSASVLMIRRLLNSTEAYRGVPEPD